MSDEALASAEGNGTAQPQVLSLCVKRDSVCGISCPLGLNASCKCFGPSFRPMEESQYATWQESLAYGEAMCGPWTRGRPIPSHLQNILGCSKCKSANDTLVKSTGALKIPPTRTHIQRSNLSGYARARGLRDEGRLLLSATTEKPLELVKIFKNVAKSTGIFRMMSLSMVPSRVYNLETRTASPPPLVLVFDAQGCDIFVAALNMDDINLGTKEKPLVTEQDAREWFQSAYLDSGLHHEVGKQGRDVTNQILSERGRAIATHGRSPSQLEPVLRKFPKVFGSDDDVVKELHRRVRAEDPAPMTVNELVSTCSMNALLGVAVLPTFAGNDTAVQRRSEMQSALDQMRENVMPGIRIMSLEFCQFGKHWIAWDIGSNNSLPCPGSSKEKVL